ncbi:ATP-binding protein [Actinophytocola xanthii]|uniref:Uncharacterized protein n=1 Tax=Actinophytocola xanthii TaxID=1912961 RepID=A0A1Q8CG90_9PSEU|nr:tetratricopeptide repeat protein [Actinophytocola xanthii]OLF13385.1 hypothetical protein BU204_27300 [Actinophytocola xanthii]
MVDPPFAVHRSILVVDVERFGSPVRTDGDRVAVRSGLYGALENAFAAASVPWADCDHEDRGDGVLVIIPPTIPKSVLVRFLPDRMIAELRVHNDTHDIRQQIRLRVAVHAGEVHYDEHGVVGTSVNHAFRLLDAAAFRTAFAHSGAQLGMIVSTWFFDEVVRHVDGGIAAEYQRVDVVSKETTATAWMRVPDRSGAGLVVDPSVPRQLPPASRSFVGREDELDRLASFLHPEDAPMVLITALTGTAGIGKTALAIRWAHLVQHLFPDGQLHVDLRGFDQRVQLDPAHALRGFLEALGIASSAIPDDVHGRSALYRSLVAERRMLVVLDNARSADQVRPLLPNSSTCLVVVTSRNRMDGLVVREGVLRIELDVLPHEDAVGVLAARIGPARLSAEPQAVAQLIERCARLPLALSIAAARAVNQPNLSLSRLADQLRDERHRLDVLDLGERDLDVRAVLSWSYQVLSAPAAHLFRLIGVHPGPDIDALACRALLGPGRVGPLLTELTAAHLLEEHEPGRYRFHDLLRTYAEECAERDEPDLAAAKTRIVDFYIDAATVAHHHIQPCWNGQVRTPPSSAVPPHLSGYQDAVAWFDRENATLLAVVDFAAQNGLGDQLGRLARPFSTFITRIGLRHERAALWRTTLAAARDSDSRLVALPELARALARLGRFDQTTQLLDEANELANQCAETNRAICIQLTHTMVFELQDRHLDALHYAEQAWELARAQPSLQPKADALTAIARQRTWLGSPEEALALTERALALYRRIGHREGEAFALESQGYAHRCLGQYQHAVDCFERSLGIDREIQSRYWEAHTLDQLGDLHHLCGRHDEALATWQEAAAAFEALQHPEGSTVRAKLEGRREHADHHR